MPKLNTPITDNDEDIINEDDFTIDDVGVSDATTAASNIAQITAQAGGEIQQQGQELLEKSQQAFSNSVYSIALDKARNELQQKADERLSNNLDENGNPNFKSIPDDIAAIGQRIQNDFSALLIDPLARQQFNKDFTDAVNTKVAEGARQANKLENQFNQASIKESIKNSTNNAISGNWAEAPSILNNLQKKLNTALDSGVIDKRSHDELLNGARKTVYKTKWDSFVNAQPEQALQVLNGEKSPEQVLGIETTGLNAQEKQKFRLQAKSAIEDNRSSQAELSAVEEFQAASQINSKLSSATEGNNTADLVQLFNNGDINQSQLADRLSEQTLRRVRNNQDLRDMIRVQQLAKNRETIPVSMKSVANKAYEAQLEMLRKSGKEVTPALKAQLSKQYRGVEIRNFNDTLEQGTQIDPSDEQAGQYLAAFRSAKNDNNVPTSLNDRTKTIYNNALKLHKAGASAGSALKESQELYSLSNSATGEQINPAFKEKFDFTGTNPDAEIDFDSIVEQINESENLQVKGIFDIADLRASPELLSLLKLKTRQAALRTRTRNFDAESVLQTGIQNLPSTFGRSPDGESLVIDAPSKLTGVDNPTIQEEGTKLANKQLGFNVNKEDLRIRALPNSGVPKAGLITDSDVIQSYNEDFQGTRYNFKANNDGTYSVIDTSIEDGKDKKITINIGDEAKTDYTLDTWKQAMGPQVPLDIKYKRDGIWHSLDQSMILNKKALDIVKQDPGQAKRTAESTDIPSDELRLRNLGALTGKQPSRREQEATRGALAEDFSALLTGAADAVENAASATTGAVSDFFDFPDKDASEIETSVDSAFPASRRNNNETEK